MRRLGLIAALAAAALAGACQVDQLLHAPDNGGNPPGPPPPSAQAPRAPTGLGQFRLDGTPVGSGSTIAENGIEIRAMVSDPEPGDSVRLQLELRFTGTSFTGVPTHLSGRVGSGSFAVIRLESGLADTSYQWQVRAVDHAGRASEWVPFSAEASFRVSVPRIPLAPGGLAQFHADGETPIPVGGITPNRDVWLSVIVQDSRLGPGARVEFEVRNRETPFTGNRTHSTDDIDQGERSRVRFRASSFVAYHWQARVCDEHEGETVCSAWVGFGGNGEDETDFLRNPFEDDDLNGD